MLYLFTFIFLFITDLLAFNNPLFGKIGTVLWVFSWLFVFLFAAKQFIGLIKLAWDKNLFMTLILVFILGGIVLVNTTNPKNISGETTQEINCMLTHFESSADWGFQKTCLFGYPARQFIIPALPSLIFGRSLFALNFGGALYFVIGLIIFASGLLNYLGKNKTNDIIVSIILSFIFHIYYFNHFMFFYEQSIYPFCFTLLIGGLFLFHLTKKSSEIVFLLALSLFYLVFSYTPGLAVFFLAVLSLFFMLINKKTQFSHKIIIGVIIATSILSYLVTLKFRGDIKLIQITQTAINVKQDLITTFNHLLFQRNGNPLVSPILNFIFLSLIFLSLILFFGWSFFIGAVWAMSVIILSVISKGYAYYGVDFRLHRATVIFPPLFIMVAFIFKKYINKLKKLNTLLFVFLILMIASGIKFQINSLKNKPKSKHFYFINWLIEKKIIRKNSKEMINIYLTNNTSSNYISLNDELQYFINSAKSNVMEPYCINLNLLPTRTGLIFLSKKETSFCLKNIKETTTFLTEYVVDDNTVLDLYQIN